jgi:hypothetical protein
MLRLDHSGQRLWRVHAPCTLKIFRKKNRISALYPLLKTKLFVPTQISLYFQWQSKADARVGPSLPSYLDFIYCWNCSRPENSWNIAHWKLNNNQSINQMIDSSRKTRAWPHHCTRRVWAHITSLTLPLFIKYIQSSHWYCRGLSWRNRMEIGCITIYAISCDFELRSG